MRIFVRPEIFVYAAIAVFAGLFLVLGFYNGNVSFDSSLARHYYENLSGARLWWTIVLFLIAVFFRGVVLWITALLKGLDPATVFSRKNIEAILPRVRSFVKNVLIVGIPSMIAFWSTSSALGQLNIFNGTRLRDELLFRFDTLLTGTFPPLASASFSWPHWFIGAVEFCFMHLVWFLMILGAYLFISHQRLFREAIGAFFLGLMILYAGWLVFPVLSPNDRFVANVYNLSIPPVVQQYVDEYAPQKEIEVFWEKINASREGLSVLPTTAFPSAHVVWGVFLVYYSYRVWKWLLIVSLPFAILSTFGTNLFAAHYFVDIPSGIATGILSIYVVRWMQKQHEKTNKPLREAYA